MNERIRELGLQALQLVADEHTNGDESRLNLASYAVKDLIQEKFAELIIRKCCEISDETEQADLPVVSSKFVKAYFGLDTQ